MTTATPPIAAWLAELLPPGRPRRVSHMLPTGPDKYRDLKGPLPCDWLDQHAAGTATYAATIDADERSCLGVIDLDTGGRPALLAVLARLQERGRTAFAIQVTTPNGHDGGHIVVLYQTPAPVADIRAELDACAPGAELWPSRNVIRLPFGLHQRAHTRGQLIIADGACYSLDEPTELAAGFEHVRGLPRNVVPAPAPLPEPAPPIVPAEVPVRPTARAGRLDGKAVIRAFNEANPLPVLLERYGAHPTGNGYTCPCGEQHTHETTLTISSRGKLFSYSTECRWRSELGLDAFGLFCLVEHGNDNEAALKAINPPQKRQRNTAALDGLAPEHLAEAQRRADAARKQEARKQSATSVRAAMEGRAKKDDQLSQTAQIVLCALLDIAGKRDWCRPSVAGIATLIGKSVRTVHRAIGELEAAHYITSGDLLGPGKTTLRTFIAEPPAPAEPDVCMCAMPEAVPAEPALMEAPKSVTTQAEDELTDAQPDVCMSAMPDAPEGANGTHVLYKHVYSCSDSQRACEGGAPCASSSPRPPSQAPTGPAVELLEPVAGPDGALAYPDGAAWLPTDAACAWWEASWAPAPPAADPVGPIELDPPPAEAPVLQQPASRPVGAAYWERLALLSMAALVGERVKLQRTLAKHQRASWARDIRARLRAVEDEIAARSASAAPAPPTRPASSAPAGDAELADSTMRQLGIWPAAP